MEKVMNSILDEARAEAKATLTDAERQAHKMIDEAKKEREAALKKAEEEAQKRLESQKKEKIAWARLERKRILAEAKDDAINEVLEQVYSRLADIRKHNGYASFMKRRLAQGLEEMGTDSVTVYVGKGDRKYLNSAKIKVVESLESFGGLVIESNDGKVRIDSTVESLFEYIKPDLRKRIYDILYG